MLAIFPFTTTESITLESQNQAKNIQIAPGVHELWSDKQTDRQTEITTLYINISGMERENIHLSFRIHKCSNNVLWGKGKFYMELIKMVWELAMFEIEFSIICNIDLRCMTFALRLCSASFRKEIKHLKSL